MGVIARVGVKGNRHWWHSEIMDGGKNGLGGKVLSAQVLELLTRFAGLTAAAFAAATAFAVRTWSFGHWFTSFRGGIILGGV